MKASNFTVAPRESTGAACGRSQFIHSSAIHRQPIIDVKTSSTKRLRSFTISVFHSDAFQRSGTSNRGPWTREIECGLTHMLATECICGPVPDENFCRCKFQLGHHMFGLEVSDLQVVSGDSAVAWNIEQPLRFEPSRVQKRNRQSRRSAEQLDQRCVINIIDLQLERSFAKQVLFAVTSRRKISFEG